MSTPTKAPSLTGVSLIAGRPADRSGRGSHRAVEGSTGQAVGPGFVPATSADVEAACTAAWTAFHELESRSGSERADFLEAIAKGVLDAGEGLIAGAAQETGLTAVRLTAERERAVATIRMYAESARRGECSQPMIDTGEPSRRPVPKPDVRRINRPLGPVAVMGPGSTPLAGGVIGSDVASALAAGCPVVFKGHPGHPATGEALAWAVARAAEQTQMPAGTFSYLVSDWPGEVALAGELLRHPCVRAVGFSGSGPAGVGAEQAVAARGDRVPFFGILGAVNPVFVLPDAAESEVADIGTRLVSTVLTGSGQTCLRPGLVFLVRSGESELALRAMSDAIALAPPQPLIHARAVQRFNVAIRAMLANKSVEIRGGAAPDDFRPRDDGSADRPFRVAPVALRTGFESFRRDPRLRAEVFGPAVIAVVCDHEGQLVDAAASFQGALTASICSGLQGASTARRLQTVLEQRVARLLFNALPTWVEPCAAMCHTGPYPAGTRPDVTAAGPLAALRWTRPVCYQNAPEAFLPAELRTANPRMARRLINGALGVDEREDLGTRAA